MTAARGRSDDNLKQLGGEGGLICVLRPPNFQTWPLLIIATAS